MGAVDYVDRGVARHSLRAREEDVAVARQCGLRSWVDQAGGTARVDRQHVVLSCLDVPERDHLDQLVAMLSGDIMIFRKVLSHVIELPSGCVQLCESFGGDRRAKELPRLGERRSGPGTDGAPAIVIDRAMPHHLEVLRVSPAGGSGVGERLGEAHALNRRLCHAADGLRRLDAQAVEHRWHKVDGMNVLVPRGVLGLRCWQASAR